MSTENEASRRHRLVSDIFLRVCDAPADEKHEALEAACEGDLDLRSEVEELLGWDRHGEESERSPTPPEGDRPIPAPEIPGYEVHGRLGEGGMGSVWRATQQSTNRQVALKILGARAFTSPRAHSRFEREIELAASLEHPRIARVYDSGVHAGIPFYAMELIDGAPLDQALEGKSAREKVEAVAEVAEALSYAHRQGVIHRDLKPSNILVASRSGEPSILDFGLAKSLLEEDTVDLSLTGQILGTPAYMAPEQASGFTTDTRTDVFALGTLLFRTLTGRLPHDRDPSGSSHGTPFEILRSIAEMDAPRLRSLRPDLDRDLEAVVSRALGRKPAARYSSAAEFTADLRRWLEGEAVHARALTPFALVARWWRRHWLLAGTAATLLLLASISLFLYTVSLQNERRTSLRWAYNYGVQLASRHLEANEPLPASVLLDDSPEGLRGWEWKWLKGLVDSSDRTIGPFENKIRDLAFTPDGSRLVLVTGRAPTFSGGAPELAVVDVHAGKVVRTIRDGEESLDALALTPDGREVYTGGRDGILRRYEIESGRLLQEETVGWIFGMDVSPDGEWIAWGTFPDGLTLKHLESGKTTFLPGPGGQDDAVDFSSYGKTLVWSYRTWRDGAGHLVIVDVERGMERHRRRLENAIRSVSYDPTGARVAFGLPRSFGIWDLEKNQLERFAFGLWRTIPRYDTAGNLLVSDQVATVGKWTRDRLVGSGGDFDVVHLQPDLKVHGVGSDYSTARLTVSGNGELVASGSTILKIWSLSSVPQGLPFDRHGEARSIGASTPGIRMDSTGRRIVHTGDDNRLVVQDPSNAERRWEYHRNEPEILRDADWYPDGNRVAAAWAMRFDIPDEEGPLSTLTVHEGTLEKGYSPIAEKKLPEYRIWALKISPDGSVLAAFHAGRPGTVEEASSVLLLDARTLELRTHYEVYRHRVQRAPKLRFSPDGRILTLANGCGFVVWDVRENRRLHFDQADRSDHCYAALPHPDGEHLVVAEREVVNLRRLDGLQLVRRLAIHPRQVTDMKLSPDGERLITGSADATVRIWDASNGRALVSLPARASVTSVEMSPDGKSIFSSAQGTVLKWSVRGD